MIRIAWITTGFSANETDYSGNAAMHNLARELSHNSEIELTVFSLYHPANKPDYTFHGAHVKSFGSGRVLSYTEKLRIWKKCKNSFIAEHKQKPFSIIHSMWAGESGYVASSLSKTLKIPLIINICGGELADLPKINYGSRTRFWQKYFVNKSFNRADKIISGSEFITNKIALYYNKNIQRKVVNIPFGVDDTLFKPGNSNRGFTCLICIAHAVPVKSHDTLFNALAIVKESFPEIRLFCYGRDDRNVLTGLIQKYGLEESVVLCGFIDYEKIPDALSGSGVFVVSSLYESQNMSMLEAAFCGLPVVSANAGAAREITGHLTEPGIAKELAEKIIYVINNYEIERQKSLAVRNSLVKKFGLKYSAKRFIELYNSLV
jgi:glycosyltransferase involved in cell wall biosynthesis